MRLLTAVLYILLFQMCACTSSKTSFFGKKTAHEKYGEKLTDAGLDKSKAGRSWFTAADNALRTPVRITIPYKETGFFGSAQPSAAAFIFTAKRGEKISASVNTVPAGGFMLFIDLWANINGKRELLFSSDSSSAPVQHIVENDGEYIIRLQPELLQSAEYTITIHTGPSLAFPVDKSGNPKLISLWGVDRDGGARSHEGVDIGAKKRTPALASAGGYITRVNENNLGGKVVFLQDENTGNNLYYAHLDSQMVRSGQRVKTGDIIGLVGNTGNARNTAPHLHFGIYASGGPIDPLAFIDNRNKQVEEIKAPLPSLDKWMHITSATGLLQQPVAKSKASLQLSKNDAVFLIGASGGYYKVQLPGGEQGYIPYKLVSDKNILTLNMEADKRILDEPALSAPAKAVLHKGKKVTVKGTFKEYYLVADDKMQGWMIK